ncbi:MAG TPA: hypothetical protein VG498_13075 [Terriglobales bacterium]|nr:hypothetical protein [Terriglobales bacterium]
MRYLHWLKFVPSVFIALEYLVIVMVSAFSGAVASYGPGLRISDPDVRRGSARAVAVAIWMAPLMLLFQEGSALSGLLAGAIVLAGYASVGNPARERSAVSEPVPAHGMKERPRFALTPTHEFAKQFMFAIFTATLLQTAALADLIRERGLALVLFVAGAAVLAARLRFATDDSRDKGPRLRSTRYLLASATMTAVVIVIGLFPLLVSLGRPTNLLDALLRRLWFRGGSPHIARSHSVRIEQTRVRNDGYIGVVLTPKQTESNPIPALPQISFAAQAPSFVRPLMIPFTGSYWFFQSPFSRPPMDSVNAEGDPASVGVRSSNYRPLLMEAVQNLYQPLETARVGEVQLAMFDVDPLPGTVSVELVLSDTSVWGHPAQSLGVQRVGAPTLVERTSNSHSENLNFAVPKHSRCREFNQMRLIFTLDPSRSRLGASVAVQSFMLVPRVM